MSRTSEACNSKCIRLTASDICGYSANFYFKNMGKIKADRCHSTRSFAYGSGYVAAAYAPATS
ncbi:MAG: hypothetical protein NT027_10635 [Proteobacteria bacterium]|nr:hypothetical protein [Pseudomonadota bacterium]